MTKQQSDAVAQIALNLSDKPIPTAAEILSALNRAYEAGFKAGDEKEERYRRIVSEVLSL